MEGQMETGVIQRRDKVHQGRSRSKGRGRLKRRWRTHRKVIRIRVGISASGWAGGIKV